MGEIQMNVGVVGSGNMGKQLALLFAVHGYRVCGWSRHEAQEVLPDIRRIAVRSSRMGLFSRGDVDDILARIEWATNADVLAECGVVIEAVAESLEVKCQVHQQLVSVLGEGAIIGTNTSTLSITEMAACTGHSDRVVGIHFFNPPQSMRLVEIIQGELTSGETVEKAIAFVETLDKQHIVLPESPGFVVNRLLFTMINEAIFLVAEGVGDAKSIDSCMKLGANHPMGPLELADFIGLDICLAILSTLVDETGDSKYRPAPLLKKLVRAGKLGRKSGQGFFRYKG